MFNDRFISLICRPILHVGSYSIEDMAMFYRGYTLCAVEHDLYDDTYSLVGFQEYVQKKYNALETIDWATILQNVYTGKENAYRHLVADLNDYLKHIGKKERFVRNSEKGLYEYIYK